MNVYYRNGLITGGFAGFAIASFNGYSYWQAAIMAVCLADLILSDWRRKLIGHLPQGEPE